MAIDKRADDDNGSEDAPEPIVSCTEIVIKTSASKLVADSRGEIVSPNEIADTAGQRADDKGKEPGSSWFSFHRICCKRYWCPPRYVHIRQVRRYRR